MNIAFKEKHVQVGALIKKTYSFTIDGNIMETKSMEDIVQVRKLLEKAMLAIYDAQTAFLDNEGLVR